jgi:hypothetical protein
VVEALRGAGCIQKIVVVGSDPHRDDVTVAPQGDSFLGSLQNGVDAVNADRFFLATADIPFLTPESVAAFIAAVPEPEPDIAYSVVPRDVCEARFPGLKRTCVRLKDGEFTGGNIGLLRTAYIRERMPYLQQAYAARKRPLKLAAMIGPGLLARFIISLAVPGSLSIAYVERKVERIIGGTLRAVPIPYAEVGTDIDSLAQWRDAEAAAGSG